MRLPLFIAFRYLFSRKKISAINVINGIAILGFGVGAFAMVVILSAFNGFERLVEGLINRYDPDIKITAVGQKVFQQDALGEDIAKWDEIASVSKVIEEKVVIKFNDRQEIARIKGVDQEFSKWGFDSLVVMGKYDLGDSNNRLSVFGAGLSSKLGIFPGSHSPVDIFVPRRDVEYSSLNPSASLNMAFTRVSGLFIVHEEIDNEVFISSLDFAQNLLDYQGYITAVEIQLEPGVNRMEFKEKLAGQIGGTWLVQTREEQNEIIYKIFRSEKWFTYAILALVLLISAFNIFGSLIMLVLDKKKDVSVLKSMGATIPMIRKIFVWQGSYIALLGGGIGLILGIAVVLIQKRYGILELQQSIVEYYPVDLRLSDIIITFSTVVILGYFISLYPASRAAKAQLEKLN